ncbi:MAG: RnfABCDGE type electron transport complex subunit C [Anaerolineae bacterium]|jgi:RnfABCDGE-type electron transport complex C subunit|nr:RnfABCDGE type electron transport complex subunit C [Anaerolineae bacterium]MDH7474428.1 RnfABCDGE type electron transport complex subunit C [Anaerolineae bacterium]
MSDQIVESVRAAGVVGAGGAGFPTHVKIAARVDTVIANGAECEPLLHCDQYLMTTQADEVVEGLRLVMQASGAKHGVIALKQKYQAAIVALRAALDQRPKMNVRLHLLESYYPAGDEFLLVYDVTGRLVPETGLPLHVGCIVQNVGTLANIARAQRGEPVTHRLLTVTGEVRAPKTLRVPIGTSIGEVIRWAGGVKSDSASLSIILGGPMMGRLATSLDEPVTKTTSGIIVLPADNATVRYLRRPLGSWIKRGRSTCDQCRDCTDLCPRHLLGHDLEPHKIMRTINYGITTLPFNVTAAVLCCECRLCEAYACPLELSPCAYYKEIKRQLAAQGWRNDVHKRTDLAPHPFREFRRVPTERLIGRLGLTAYAQLECPLDPGDYRPERVTIPLRQHIGMAARPVVRAGDVVAVGDLIGEIPEGKLGARVHASINGKVVEATAEEVVIVS